MAEQVTEVQVEEGWSAVEVTDAAEVEQWAKDLLAAAGPDRNGDVKTEHHRGAVIVFVVPNDIADAALKERKKRADAAERAAKKAEKAAEPQGAKDDKQKAAEGAPPAGAADAPNGPAAPASGGADAGGDGSAAGS